MTNSASPAPGRFRRALLAGLLGLAAGAVLGLLDALRCRLDPGSVLPPRLAPAVVLLYAGVVALPASIAGALLRPATAAAGVLAGTLALGAGLYANYRFLPAFLDPVSLAGDGALAAMAAAGGWWLRRRFLARGVPAPRGAAAAAGAAVLVSCALAMGGGRDDGAPPVVVAAPGDGTGASPPRGVLLVLVDTLRADAVGWSGHPAAAPTPHMDALAARGTVFTRCRAPSSWTKPSTASVLTGRWPAEHGALGFESILPGDAVTLAEAFRAAGWRTAAFADNPFISPAFGFAQGFDRFTGRQPSPLARGTLLLRAVAQARAALVGADAFAFGPGHEIGAPALLGEAVRFLADGNDGRPGFAYVHLIEPHYPYAAPSPRGDGLRRVDPPHAPGILPFDTFPALPAAEVEAMRAAYEAEVRTVDDAVGVAVAALRERGLLDEFLIVITSDHGEEFHEHGGWTHGQSLYEELVRVPLLVLPPAARRGAVRRVEAPVSLVDLMPTVLELSGLLCDAPASGRSLVPVLDGAPVAPRPSFGEVEAGPVGARSMHMGDRAVIVSRKGVLVAGEVFDLAADPGQHAPLAADAPDALWAGKRPASLLDAAFRTLEERALRRENRPFDDDTAAALRAIGYLGGK